MRPAVSTPRPPINMSLEVVALIERNFHLCVTTRCGSVHYGGDTFKVQSDT